MNNDLKLKQIIFDNESCLYGLSEDGSVWFYRSVEIRKKENDGYAGEIGELLYPVGWYPITMRRIQTVEDYENAGVNKLKK